MKDNRGLPCGVVVAIVCILAIVFGGVFFKSIFRFILIAALGVLVLLGGVIVLIIVLARKSQGNDKQPKAKNVPDENGVIQGEFKEVPSDEPWSGLDEDKAEALASGRKSLTETRMIVARIQDSEIHSRAAAVCETIDKILKTLKEKPESIDGERQFINYYIPTAGKVIRRFQNLEFNHALTSETRDNTLKFLDTTESAMEKLYTNLFAKDKLNMEVEMEAMTIAIKRDGLLEEDEILR
ncbi:MAG: 5-bromo-4-chloroindolyl phosphate hydrolysis family protein [Parasporobacterium sp.]|nr:5-bromo-4-chloroindolyl phosphate hydrolysis family protein [Parasporobacterium sp.]